jgi:hypothetical protein
VAAEHAGIRRLLLKADLIDDENAPALNAMLAVYRTLGYPVLEVSAHHGDGMERLQQTLDGHISVFVGQSGWASRRWSTACCRTSAPASATCRNVRPGHPHHHHRAAVPLPQRRRPDRLPGYP